MFILSSGDKFYTGRAGDGWLSLDRNEAFTYGPMEAARKAEMFNRMSALHKQTFTPVEA
jgi:hypothetical protein